MKKILSYIKEYLKENFHWKLYLTTAIFLAICLAFNYWLDFEDDYIDQYTGRPIKWLWMFLFQSIPFLSVCFFIYLFGINKDWIKKRSFWVKFFIGFGILALDRSFYGHYFLIDELNAIDKRFIGKLIRWSSSLVVSVLPLILFYFIYEKDNKSIYGLAPKKWDLKPYLILLGLTGIVIALGSFLPDIQEFYPKYRRSGGGVFAQSHKISEWVSVLMYEISYGSDFVSVELFFRGFLIMAFSRIVGPQVILAMCASYCFLHFGKPLGESISSIFGGFILGIISLRTQHIWGGIMIHVGVAWLMELFGYLQSLR
ncbi:MAG: CPBP family intramembrane metalloprotease [bacterium]|nr:CPBP family intramembrane metalloprotease [bacterium]